MFGCVLNKTSRHKKKTIEKGPSGRKIIFIYNMFQLSYAGLTSYLIGQKHF